MLSTDTQCSVLQMFSTSPSGIMCQLPIMIGYLGPTTSGTQVYSMNHHAVCAEKRKVLLNVRYLILSMVSTPIIHSKYSAHLKHFSWRRAGERCCKHFTLTSSAVMPCIMPRTRIRMWSLLLRGLLLGWVRDSDVQSVSVSVKHALKKRFRPGGCTLFLVFPRKSPTTGQAPMHIIDPSSSTAIHRSRSSIEYMSCVHYWMQRLVADCFELQVRLLCPSYMYAYILRPDLVPKNFYPKLSHRILRHMHRVLNIDEKKLIAQFEWKSRDECFKTN